MESNKTHKNHSMSQVRKDGLTDVVQNLPAMASGNENKPAGTVVTSDGTRVTLGEQRHHNAAISSPQQGMNTGKK
jgi:hypothetical protein